MNPQLANTTHHLFSYEGNLQQDGKPAGSLLSFAKNLVAPKSRFDFKPKNGSCFFILPLEGKVSVSKDEVVNTFGSTFACVGKDNEPIVVANPDESNSSSFLTIEMAVTSSDITSFELMKDNYQTIGFEESQPFEVHIGSFGRQVEGSLKLAENSNAFCFAIHGEVEIEDRLLAAGDSLYLRNCSQINIESFDENCVLLVLEEKG